jgi:tetratricopeptide (TPR) repeat protein
MGSASKPNANRGTRGSRPAVNGIDSLGGASSVQTRVPEPDPTSSPSAVFLSYASQDSDAARRLCDALQSAGVEVWFDQSELRGGDAWDAKLRRQIRECALFMPIISANTQRRKEGYFRLEWRLAEQRTHLMGRDRAFLLPICVDDTRDSDADVPDAFLGVQWTRLKDGVATPAFVERVKMLIAHGGEAPPGRAPQRPAGGGREGALPVRRTSRLPSWKFMAVVVAAALGAASVFFMREHRAAPPGEVSLPPEAANLIAKTRDILGNLNYRRSDLELAEGFMARATDLAPDSAEAWALRGRIEATFVQRTWDYGDARLRDAQAFCDRALGLDRNNTEAMWGLAQILNFQGAHNQAEGLMRQAIRIKPNDPTLRRLLGVVIFDGGRRDEGVSIERECVTMFPNDALSWYDLGLLTGYNGDPNGALAAYRESAAKGGQFGGAYIVIAGLLLGDGDVAGAQAALDHVPLEDRSEDRPISAQMRVALIARQPERAIEAGGLTAGDYFDDAQYRGPKAYLLALAYGMSGKPALAEQQWNEGIRVMRDRLEKRPSDVDRINLAIGLAWKGDKAEAAAIADPIAAEQREMAQGKFPASLAEYYAGIGDGADTVFFLRVLQRQFSHVRPKALELDPWFDRVRQTPEFREFIAELSRGESATAGHGP